MLKLIQIATSSIVAILLFSCIDGAKSDVRSKAIAQKANNTIRSEYTSLESNSCKTIQFDEETKFSTHVCPSYKNIPVFIYQTDGLYSLRISQKGNNEPLGFAFGRLGDKLEWRLQNDEPFAVIYRYYGNGSSSKPIDSSVLAIQKVSEDVGDCIAATVDGNLPNANEIARRFADEQIANFECDVHSRK